MTTARDIMTRKVITIEPSVSATDAAKIMDKKKVSSLIINKNEKPYGIVTERDLSSKVVAQNKKPSDAKASDIMSSPLVIVSPLTPVEEVAEKMITNKIRRIVVIDGDQPIGIITVTDFVKHLHSMLSASEEYDKDLYQGLFEDWEYWNE